MECRVSSAYQLSSVGAYCIREEKAAILARCRRLVPDPIRLALRLRDRCPLCPPRLPHHLGNQPAHGIGQAHPQAHPHGARSTHGVIA